MNKLLLWTGRTAGVVGVLVCGGSVVLRAAGNFYVGGYQVGTMLQAGMAALLVGCLAYVAALAEGGAGS
jgi:hypothetical protein